MPVEEILSEHLELPDPRRFLRRLDGGEHERADRQEQHVKADEHQQAYGGRRPHGDRAARVRTLLVVERAPLASSRHRNAVGLSTEY